MEDYEKVISNWNLLLKKSTDFDSWGQLVEAEMEYKMSVLIFFLNKFFLYNYLLSFVVPYS